MKESRSEKKDLERGLEWSGRRDSNSRHSPWQGDALPLSHSRILGSLASQRSTALTAATPTYCCHYDNRVIRTIAKLL